MLNLTYRSQSSSPLTSGQIDGNFRAIAEALAALSGSAATLVDVQLANKQLSFIMSDDTTIGPIDLSSVGGAGGSGIEHATADNRLYGSFNGDWAAFSPGIQHGLDDGLARVSKNGEWTVVTVGSGIENLPSDGKTRGVKDGEWVEITGTGGTGSDAAASLAPVDWDTTTVFAAGRIVRDGNGNLWFSNTGNQNQEPLTSNGYWQPLTLGSENFTQPITHRLYTSVGITIDQTVQDLEYRLVQAMDRIVALENRLQGAGF